MDEYCKKHNINTYTFINDNSTLYTAQLFSSYLGVSGDNANSNTSSSNVTFSLHSSSQSSGVSSSNLSVGGNTSNNTSYVEIRSSLVDKGYRFVEKKFNLSDFLYNAKALITNMASFNVISSSFLQNPFCAPSMTPHFLAASTGVSNNTSHYQAALSSSFGSSLSIASNTSLNQASKPIISLTFWYSAILYGSLFG